MIARFTAFLIAGLCICLTAATAAQEPAQSDLPTVGDSIVIDDVRVTLVGARRLTHEAYRARQGRASDPWLGGGLHLAFIVENRPNQRIGPVLGEIRVRLGSEPYTGVSNSTAQKPPAPDIVVDEVGGFFASAYGQSIRRRVHPRPNTIAAAVEVFIRGGAIPTGSTGVVELEQGATRLSEVASDFGTVSAHDIAYHWFRFRLPPLD